MNKHMEAQSLGSIATKLVNRWAWWQNALKGVIGPMSEGQPEQGYYRTRFKGGKWEPVALWWDEDSGGWLAYRSGREADPAETWNFCRTHPITRADYDAALEGKPFPDEDAVVADQVAKAGDNSAGVDEAAELQDQIAAALTGMNAYAKIADDATAAKALSLRNRLNELSNQADKKREALKKPHFEAGKAVDAKWQPLVKSAKEGANKVRDAIGSWETVKLQQQRQRERDAETARLAAEEAARAAEPQSDVALAPTPVSVAEAAPAPIKPTYGKSASVQVKTILKDVTDWTALAAYMIGHPTMQDTLRQLAQRALDAGRTNIPGITTEEKAAVR
ncbi:hypothetical protein QO002_002139 [Pararhizobium capsulatum DSM 1112]|uniref:Uncharacterized protein n=1 Tax=Pararhizobium capsulatum DSM 1112 TaxID=1121113 RepID=A0ABU0BQP3_9HYPH|nr:hypothetical protein [Pararhizobium capsulatum]MDQ0320001.1 hypothetical protein [Pararhizobium capsulatum DSM 1112]